MMDKDSVVRCDEGLVRLLYGVLLGRDPESRDLWLGAPLPQAAETIIASDEFRQIADTSLTRTFSNSNSALSSETRRNLADALQSLGAPTPRSRDYFDLLLSALEWLNPSLSDALSQRIAVPVAESIRDHFVAPVELEDVLETFLQFDRGWFERALGATPEMIALDDAAFEPIVIEAVQRGKCDLVAHFTTRGRSNAALRASVFGATTPTSVQQLIQKLRQAVREGRVGHWLFDEDYYSRRRDLARHRGELAWAPLSVAYLDFLGNGDRHGLRPHPLFCPVAYRRYSPGSDTSLQTFSAFVKAGQLAEARTSALFDPDFFLSLNPLAVQSVAEREFLCALECFVRSGLKEGCAFSPDFDHDFYVEQNAELPSSAFNQPGGPAWHFVSEGAEAGLASNPFFDPSFYTTRYSKVAEDCRRLAIAPIEHFLLYGKEQELLPCEPLADRMIDMAQAKGLYERRAREALRRQKSRPFDFGPFSGPDPILSLVLPVRDQAAFTARFLELAHVASAELKRRTGRDIEMIVVDNGSADRTGEVLGGTKGIVVETSREPLGFTKAANAGARAAKGDFLLIANNDVEFDAGLFADIVQSLEGSVDCGVLGVKVLSMNLTVQEVGAFLEKSGETGGRGRGASSLAFAEDRKRVVDYVSGCFLLVRRDDFEALGGFDEDFTPGYYEDVDFCLRMVRDLQKTVMVDPSLSITHYENASFMAGRPIATVYPLVLRNRQKLLRKHPQIATGSRMNLSRVLLVVGSGYHGEHVEWAAVPEALRTLGMPFDILALDPSAERALTTAGEQIQYRAWMPSQGAETVLQGASEYSHIWVRGIDAFNDISLQLQALSARRVLRIICEIGGLSEPVRTVGSVDQPVDILAARLSRIGLADEVIASDRRSAELIAATGLAAPRLMIGTMTGGEKSDDDSFEGLTDRVWVALEGSA